MKSLLLLAIAAAAIGRASAEDLRVRVAAVRDMRGSAPEFCEIDLRLIGDDAAAAIGYRVDIDEAVDDTGAELEPLNTADRFQPFPPGNQADRVMRIQFSSPSRSAKSLKMLSGRLALMMADADSAVTVDHVPDHLGEAIVSPALAAADVSVALFDKAAALKRLADASPVDPDAVTSLRPESAIRDMLATSVLLRVRDPGQRVLRITLVGRHSVTIYGGSDYPMSGVREIHYGIGEGIQPDTQLVVYLLSDKSIRTIPVRLTNLTLP